MIVRPHGSISLINSKMGDVLEYRNTIWVDMRDITKKLIFHGAVLENIDDDALMKEAREAHLLTASIRSSVDNDMEQEISAAARVGSLYSSMTQLVTPKSGGCLDDIHQALNMGYQNIGGLQKALTGLCNVVGTLEQKMYHMSQNGIYQLIRGSSTDAPRYDIEVQLYTLIEELCRVQQLMERGSFNTVVVDFRPPRLFR